MSKHAVYYLWQLLKLDRNAVFTQCSAAHYLHAYKQFSLFIMVICLKLICLNRGGINAMAVSDQGSYAKKVGLE